MKGRGIEGTFLLVLPRGCGAWVFLFGEGRLCNRVKEIVILSSFQQLRNKVSPLLMKEHGLLVLGFPRQGGVELQVLALGLALVFL